MTELMQILRQFSSLRMIVVGDLVLDEYVFGDATRMSREAPVPVLEYHSRRYIAGGAANPSVTATSLGADVMQIGVVGADDAAEHLRAALREKGIDETHLVVCDDRPTTVKLRLFARMGLRFPQQVARLDTLSRDDISPATQTQLTQHIRAALADCQVLLFSDYQNGLITPEMVADVIEPAREQGVLLAADAQGQLHKYGGFDLVKCNADEAAAYVGKLLDTDADYERAACTLFAQLDLHGAMVITRGSAGATVATSPTDAAHCPAPRIRDVFDTVGAGDTAIAVMSLARAAGASYKDAVTLANVVSGIVVQHLGNYAPDIEEVEQAIARGL